MAEEKSLRELILDMDRKFTARFDTNDQQHELMEGRFNTMDRRFDTVDDRFDTVDKRFDAVDERFGLVDKRFDERDAKFDMLTDLVLDIKKNMVTKAELEEVKSDVKTVKVAVKHLSKQLNDHIKDKRVHATVGG